MVVLGCSEEARKSYRIDQIPAHHGDQVASRVVISGCYLQTCQLVFGRKLLLGGPFRVDQEEEAGPLQKQSHVAHHQQEEHRIQPLQFQERHPQIPVGDQQAVVGTALLVRQEIFHHA